MNTPHRASAAGLQDLWAWATITESGEPSLVGTLLPGIGHQPLIAFKRELIEKFRAVAVAHGRALEQPVFLLKFEGMIVEEIAV